MTRRTRLDITDKTIRKIINRKAKLLNGSPTAGSHSLRFAYFLLVILIGLNTAVLLSNPEIREFFTASTPAPRPVISSAPSPATSRPAVSSQSEPTTPLTPETTPVKTKEIPEITAVEQQKEPAPLPRKIQVEILNGCGVNGLARRATGLLRKAGFDVVNTDNYQSQNVRYSFIIDRTGNKETAKKLAKALGIPESRIRTQKDLSLALDVTLVLGKDYRKLKLFKR